MMHVSLQRCRPDAAFAQLGLQHRAVVMLVCVVCIADVHSMLPEVILSQGRHGVAAAPLGL